MAKVLLFLFLMALVAEAQTQCHYYNGEQKVMLTPIQSLGRSFGAYDFYRDEKGVRLGIAKGILLGLSDEKNLEAYLQEFDAKLIKKLGSGIYLLEVSDKSKTIDAANALREKEDALFAHPDFLKQRRAR